MNAEGFGPALEARVETELGRLGSEKLLIALTGASLEPGPVLAVAAATPRAAADPFAAWARDEPDGTVGRAFAEAATLVRDHTDRVVESGPIDETAGEPLAAGLDGREGAVARVGAGLAGWPLVARRVHAQAVSFFINEADTRRTELFRDLRDETDRLCEDGTDLLGTVCADDDDWALAVEAAADTVRTAYDDYADRLSAMGLDPKPIC